MYRYAIVAVLAVVLCATHWKAYVVGKTTVMSQWQQEKTQAALEAEQIARKKEQELTAAKDKAEKQYVEEKRKASKSAASASAELDRLRDQLSVASINNNHCPCTESGTNGSTGLERELLGHCAASLVQLAAEADRLETVIVGLQSYVKDVCLAQR